MIGLLNNERELEAYMERLAALEAEQRESQISRFRRNVGPWARQMGERMLEAAQLPGDIAAGREQWGLPSQLSEEQLQRAEELAGFASTGGFAAGGLLGEAGSIAMGGARRSTPRQTEVSGAMDGAPAITGRADPAHEVLRQRAQQMELKPKQRTQSTGENVFETTPEAYARTTEIVPQRDFSHQYPQPVPGKPLPQNERMRPILDNKEEIAREYARRMAPFANLNVGYFYHTGPIREGMGGLLDPRQGDRFMDRFAATYGGSSPRTATEPNLLSSSLLSYKHQQGIPFDRTVLPTGTANDIGYPMMDMHRNLSRDMLEGNFDFNKNPKPNSFRENVLGNLQGVTADKHNIRGILVSMDAVRPGSIPREWFTSDAAFRQYREQGLTPDLLKGSVDDTLNSQTFNKITRQSEYGPIASITQRSGEILGLPPAEAQALGWFGLGDMTNLKSAPKTLTELVNERINITAQHLGIPPEEVARMYGRGEIPLMQGGVPVMPTGLLQDEDEEQGLVFEVTPRSGR